MNVLVKNLGQGIKNVKINDPKTYNSLSFVTLNTNGLRIKELHDLNSKEFNLNEEEGISSRIKKI